MARPTSKHPTELELEILKVLWADGPLPVRAVRKALAPGRKLAYTSVMTIMNIMVDKGYLGRTRDGASFVYQPRVTEKATTRRILKDMVDRVFDGSAGAIMVSLLETSSLDKDELDRIRQLLRDSIKGSEQ